MLSVLIDSGAGQAGKLIAFDLNERRPLWSRSWSEDNLTYGPIAVGSVIVMARSGTVTGFAASTGAVRWVHGGGLSALGGVKPVAGPGNLVLLYDLLQYNLSPPGHPYVPVPHLFPVTALDATTGAVVWRAKSVGGVDEVYVVDGMIIVITTGPGRLTLLRPSGSVIWSVPVNALNDIPATIYDDATWVDTGDDLIYVDNLVAGDPVALVDRRLSDGAVRWSAPLGGGETGATVVRPAGGTSSSPRPQTTTRRPPRSPSTRRPGRSARPRPWRRRPLPRSPSSAVTL